MNKNKPFGELFYRSLKKTLLTMRIAVILMILGILQARANDAYSQKTRLSLNFSDTALVNVLDKIEDESEFFFLYNEKLLDTDRKISITANDQLINVILDNLFAGTDVKYTIIDRKIILAPDYLTEVSQLQQKRVTGTVTDKNGPIPGANVVVTGTTLGAITDINGKYSIDVPQGSKSLTFTFVGMEPQEITIGTLTQIDVTMAESSVGLDEVVVIGYGTQKRVNLTGSVAAVSEKDITKLSVTQTSQLLTGLVSGLTVEQFSAQPGKDQVNITVRGLGTFSSAGTEPLVLVDGLASSLDNVNISDIASISVLKDAASASIYGARAANGVILVETKKGKEGQFRVSYQGSVGLQRPSEIIDLVDSWEYAVAYNEALVNAGGSPLYSDEQIALFKSGTDPDHYPNARHYDDLITSGNGFQTDHHLSFSGGTDKNTYMFSGGYLNQGSIIAETLFKRYNMLVNLDSKISDKLKMNVKFSGQKGVSNEPTHVDKNPALGVEGLVNYSIKNGNYIPGRLSDGYYGDEGNGANIEASMDSESFISNDDVNAVASVGLDYNILKDLVLTGKFGYEYSTNLYKFFRPTKVVTPFLTLRPSELRERSTANSLLTLQAYLNYNLVFGEHSMNFLAGYSKESDHYQGIQAFRDNFPNNLIYEIDAGSASNQQSSGSAYEWALMSFFGRFNYNFSSKYLFEANFRYDGSSRFPESKKFGLFPSASFGWNISEEDFFKVSWINNLKLRASYGELGNQNIGNYPYQQMLTLGLNAPFGESEVLSSGAAATVVPNPSITWESTRIADIGIDLSILKDKLSFFIDYYDKLTSGILYNITSSAVLGMTPSVTNAGSVSNRGIDLNVQHRNTIGDFSYNIAANFSFVKNKVVSLSNVTRDINNGLFVGYPLGSIYGYVADGLFVDQEDIDNSHTQPYVAHPGDIKFVDISGPDGVPDGRVTADDDRKIIGTTFPKYSFGGNVNLGYKGFDLLIQLQGVAGYNQILTGYAGNAFRNGANPQRWMFDDHWTKENPNPDAAYPRFLVENQPQTWASTFVMLDASYLRINNIQLGYNLPKKLTSKLNISDIRLFVAIKNLHTFDHFRDGWDPGIRSYYPSIRYSSIGINANF